MEAVCTVCMHRCSLKEGQTGRCRARKNVGGSIRSINYGKITSIALDPIEKKPLALFQPGSLILSVGSSGCNLRCPFCQNHQISMADAGQIQTLYMDPEQLCAQAASLRGAGNIGVAYTYNEPLIGLEYVRDCARLVREAGMENVVVTNGSFPEETLMEVLPYVDAMNVDLKSFSQAFYEEIGGSLDIVRRFIARAARECHVEVTTLIIPGKNDTLEEMECLSQWLAAVDPKIPLHVTRFFPRYKMEQARPTPVRDVRRLAQAARRELEHVFIGNC